MLADSSSTQHGFPTAGASCACCWDDLETSNYVEYQAEENSVWLASGYCQGCITQLINTQWETYTNSLSKTTCKAEQRRLLTRGPPINLRDDKVLPCGAAGDKEVFSLWFASDSLVHSAKLKGSLEGEERKKYWDEQLAFYIHDEKEEESVTK